MASTEAAPPHTLLLSLFFAAVSVITLDSDENPYSILQSVRWNLIRLSPLFSCAMVSSCVLRFLSFRACNLGDTHSSFLFAIVDLSILDGNRQTGVATEKVIQKRSRWVSPARWTFFMLATVPQFVRLFDFHGSYWTKFFVACLLVEFVGRQRFFKNLLLRPEISIWVTSPGQWPGKPLAVTRWKVDRDALKEDKPAQATDETKSEKLMVTDNSTFLELSNTNPLNTCDAVNLLHSYSHWQKKDNSTQTAISVVSKGMKRILTNGSWIWTCGHLRCLLYKVFYIPTTYSGFLGIGAEALLYFYLFHANLNPICYSAASTILKIKNMFLIFGMAWSFITIMLCVVIPLQCVNFAFNRMFDQQPSGSTPGPSLSWAAAVLRMALKTLLFLVIGVPGAYIWYLFTHPTVLPFTTYVFEISAAVAHIYAIYSASCWLTGHEFKDEAKKVEPVLDEESPPELVSHSPKQEKATTENKSGSSDEEESTKKLRAASDCISLIRFGLIIPVVLLWYLSRFSSNGLIGFSWSDIFPVLRYLRAIPYHILS